MGTIAFKRKICTLDTTASASFPSSTSLHHPRSLNSQPLAIQMTPIVSMTFIRLQKYMWEQPRSWDPVSLHRTNLSTSTDEVPRAGSSIITTSVSKFTISQPSSKHLYTPKYERFPILYDLLTTNARQLNRKSLFGHSQTALRELVIFSAASTYFGSKTDSVNPNPSGFSS